MNSVLCSSISCTSTLRRYALNFWCRSIAFHHHCRTMLACYLIVTLLHASKTIQRHVHVLICPCAQDDGGNVHESIPPHHDDHSINITCEPLVTCPSIEQPLTRQSQEQRATALEHQQFCLSSTSYKPHSTCDSKPGNPQQTPTLANSAECPQCMSQIQKQKAVSQMT